MSRISVTYCAPVQVEVDLDTGRVTRVVVCNEEVHHEQRAGALFVPFVRPYFSLLTNDGETAPTPEQIERAYATADRGNWPGWTFGR